MLLPLAGCVLWPSPATPGAPRCGAVRACSPVVDVPTVYTPFLDSMFAIFAEYGIELEPYPVAEELKQRSVTSGSAAKPRKVDLSLQAHRSAKLRHIRAAHIQGGDGLQVLNICLFPHLEFALPTFSADLVTLPGGHLIAIDCQPNDPSAPPDTDSDRLARLYTEHRERLPDGGPVAVETARFFSDNFLWSRLPLSCSTAELQALVLPAFESYLRSYLQSAEEALPAADAATLARVHTRQLEYADYRIEKDPARAMLQRLFGDEYSERLIREALFDLPRVLAAERRGDLSLDSYVSTPAAAPAPV
eukprot:scaffold7040_cov66-Phaeocystis_antarctica.AAC.9